MNKIQLLIGCLAAIFVFTLAGCTGGADGLFDSQVKFYKARNENLKRGEEGKAANDAIDKAAKEAKSDFVTLVKAKCDGKEMEKLTKHYQCATDDYVKKLGNNKYTDAGLKAACPMPDDKKVRPECRDASNKLVDHFKGHIYTE